MINFTPAEKVFIAKRLKDQMDALIMTWDKPLSMREKRIIQVMANVILNLPSQPDKVTNHRKWWQLGDW